MIAKRYSMTKNELIRLNQLKEPYYIFVGQRLLVKALVNEPVALEHTPQTTLDGVEIKPLGKGSIPAYTEEPTADASSEDVSFVPDDMDASTPGVSKEPDPMTEQEPPKETAKGEKAPVKEDTKKEAIPAAKGGYLRPVQGKTVKGFSKDNPGLNIQAPLRTPVVASQAGSVHHAGVLENLGNTVVLKHANGVLTIDRK